MTTTMSKDISVDYTEPNVIIITIEGVITMNLSYAKAQDLLFLLGHTLQEYSMEYDVVDA